MIARACVRFYTKPVNKTPWWRPGPIESTMYDIPCHRHADAFYIISQFLESDKIDKPRTEQGFLTHDGRFLDRYDAMQEAIKCGQVVAGTDTLCAELYSEDLW